MESIMVSVVARGLLVLFIVSSLLACATVPIKSEAEALLHEICVDHAEFLILDTGETCEAWGLPLFGTFVLAEDVPTFYKYLRKNALEIPQASPQ